MKKYNYPTITKKIKKYWLVEVDDYHEFNVLVDYYERVGIKCRYKELDCAGYIGCFYIGKEPKKFIKDTEYDLGSGQPN